MLVIRAHVRAEKKDEGKDKSDNGKGRKLGHDKNGKDKDKDGKKRKSKLHKVDLTKKGSTVYREDAEVVWNWWRTEDAYRSHNNNGSGWGTGDDDDDENGDGGSLA